MLLLQKTKNILFLYFRINTKFILKRNNIAGKLFKGKYII